MLNVLKEIFEKGTMQSDEHGGTVMLCSHTPKEQGVFLQDIYEMIKPKRSLEVGFALGISTLFILEKCRDHHADEKCHIVIEPYTWGNTAMYNITKEGLEKYIDIRSDLSDRILTTMYLTNERIQFAYVDTTKVFDTVLQDFYFIDKIMDIGGVIIIDDANTGGINVVIRFMNTLPHYKIIGKFGREKSGKKFRLAQRLFETLLWCIPFKDKFMPFYSLKTNRQLGLDYRCIAFKKINNDSRAWDFDIPF